MQNRHSASNALHKRIIHVTLHHHITFPYCPCYRSAMDISGRILEVVCLSLYLTCHVLHHRLGLIFDPKEIEAQPLNDILANSARYV